MSKPATSKPPGVIQDSRAWGDALDKILGGLYSLFDLACEEPLPPEQDGCTLYFEESGKTLFQVAGQFKRPDEFLQVLLDMLRVLYEPFPLGTFFLNANPAFLFNELPSQPFRLDYATLLSEERESFTDFYRDKMLPRLTELGYEPSVRQTGFFAICTGAERYDHELVSDVLSVLEAGFSVEECLDMFAGYIHGESTQGMKQHYAGFSQDQALGNRLRVSVWLFEAISDQTH